MHIRVNAFLALVLFFCAAACGSPKQTSEAVNPTNAPLDPFVLSEHPETQWEKQIGIDEEPYFLKETLAVYESGVAVLTHDHVAYRMKRNDDFFLLEKDLYETPQDLTPLLTISAGEIRLYEKDEAVRIEVVDDPLGIFVGFSEEDLTLEYWGRPCGPYPETPCIFGADPPFQPHTEWVAGGPHLRENGGLSYYGSCVLTSSPDGTVRGTFLRNAEAEREDCQLLWSSDAAALVRPDTRELVFYGGLAGKRFLDDFDSYTRYSIKACYDPYALKVGHRLLLTKREMSGSPEPEYLLGYGRYEIEARFAADGWTSEPLSMKWSEDAEDEDDYGSLFLKLNKDGRLLLIYFDGLYFYDQHAFAYLLLDAKGKLESWGGQVPIDHEIIDSCQTAEDIPPELSDEGLWGLWEDDRVFLLDDGRILVTYEHHEARTISGFTLFDPRG